MAGDIPQGGKLQLMHASVDALVVTAEQAAETASQDAQATSDQAALALLVSCVGRKLVMGARVDEEVEAVGQMLGQHTTLAGFYSNGEINPHPQHQLQAAQPDHDHHAAERTACGLILAKRTPR